MMQEKDYASLKGSKVLEQERLEADIRSFIESGGSITSIPPGTSGRSAAEKVAARRVMTISEKALVKQE